jgi:hypothetical protein
LEIILRNLVDKKNDLHGRQPWDTPL